MYDNKVHSVKNRIVSISQSYIRPIVRGKTKSPVEFGAKLDMSIDERGIARLEYLCFDAYNECDVLTGAIDRYRERTGHYSERVLVDQIYRNRANRAYCKKHGIVFPGLRSDDCVHYLPKKRNRHMRITPTELKSKEDSVWRRGATVLDGSKPGWIQLPAVPSHYPSSR